MPSNLTHHELCEELKKVEETQLLELLDIRSEDLIEKFQDLIEDNYDTLLAEIDDLRDLGLDEEDN